jgi:hypothetical protein
MSGRSTRTDMSGTNSLDEESDDNGNDGSEVEENEGLRHLGEHLGSDRLRSELRSVPSLRRKTGMRNAR